MPKAVVVKSENGMYAAMTASPITAVGKLSCVYDTSREIVAQLSVAVTNAKGFTSLPWL